MTNCQDFILDRNGEIDPNSGIAIMDGIFSFEIKKYNRLFKNYQFLVDHGSVSSSFLE